MRYNLFHQVHQGLRSLLHETALDLQRTDFSRSNETGAVMESLQKVLRLFDRHAHTEDYYIFPLIASYEPSVADAFEQEHVKDHMLADLLQQSMLLYRGAESDREKQEVGRMIQSAYTKFHAFNLEHMAKEEDCLNPLIWRYYSDAELHEVTARIIREMPAEFMQPFNECMMRGLNDLEILHWLKQVEQKAPSVVFQALFATAKQELPASRFKKLLDALTEAELA